MSMEKMAAFLADCLGHMPSQPEQVKRIVDTVKAGLTRIANGQEWPRGEADWAARAAWAAADAAAEAAYWAARAAAYAADWAAHATAHAADWAAADAAGAAHAAAEAAYWAASAAAYAAAEAHPDPDAERARQAKVREDLGL